MYHPITFLFFFFQGPKFLCLLSFNHHIWQKFSKGSDPGKTQPCTFSAFVLKQPSALVVVGGIREQDRLASYRAMIAFSWFPRPVPFHFLQLFHTFSIFLTPLNPFPSSTFNRNLCFLFVMEDNSHHPVFSTEQINHPTQHTSCLPFHCSSAGGAGPSLAAQESYCISHSFLSTASFLCL